VEVDVHERVDGSHDGGRKSMFSVLIVLAQLIECGKFPQADWIDRYLTTMVLWFVIRSYAI